MTKKAFHSILLVVCIGFSFILNAQSSIDPNKITEQIKRYKNDIRGTYNGIRWFCDDETIRMPKEPCPDSIGGIQHATYKDGVVALGKNNHIFFGQILAYTDKSNFWDAAKNHSRLKQYQLGKYLARVDNGWINRKGQFYRGAVQIEDEEAWGVAFYKYLLSKDDVIEKNYFLLMQSLKDIPNKGDSDIAQLMRMQSKVISDEFPRFIDLRTKIHSNPEAADISRILQFKNENSTEFEETLSKKIDELVATMQRFYKPVDIKSLTKETNLLSANSSLTQIIKRYINENSKTSSPSKLTFISAEVLLSIRKQVITEKSAKQRLRLLEIANQLDAIIYKEAALWQPTSLAENLNEIYALCMAIAGNGGLELWEWEDVEAILKPSNSQSITLEDLTKKLETARNVLEWSTGMVKATYKEVVNTYASFEPKAHGFIDDRIRASIALHLGRSVGELGTFIDKESSTTNKVLNLSNQSTIRGLNPGYAFGELVVVIGSNNLIDFSDDKIYVFERVPSDLKPVAGIATVTEGNLVSHVQLLARNLGIPNSILSDENLGDLKKYDGKKVFYAVSKKGNVILKLENTLTPEERNLFSKRIRNQDKITVAVEDIRLDQNKILNLRDVNADDSGKLCGPKAANLGHLKQMFPDKVVEGFVIPFGIFRDHMNQSMLGQNKSYWQFLNDMFSEAAKKRSLGIPENEIDNFLLENLKILRVAIKKIQFKADFVLDIEKSFASFLGKSIGNIPVFVRSDTNMEDLKDFTGSGLNLTIFNAVKREKIMQGIKDVWASPYKERSFRWRQKYLLNPENVFPSILIIPSVNVDYSGVLITKGIVSGNDEDLTIAFSRGAGGAVGGQVAESYLIKDKGVRKLLSPAREPYYNTLPNSGGTAKKIATFEKPLLNKRNIDDLVEFCGVVRKTFADNTKSNYKGPYDIELGFKNDKIWLFQIRPFLENKTALGSEYLESITPKTEKHKVISLASKL